MKYIDNKEAYIKQDERRLVLKKIIEDGEVFAGGIFQKEDYYMEKYGLTRDDISNMQVAIYGALKGIEITLNH